MNRPNRVGKFHKAFTLIELLLVLVIIAVLAAIVVPKMAGRTEDAKIKATKGSIAGIKTALDTFEVDNGRYPSSEEGLRAAERTGGDDQLARAVRGQAADPGGRVGQPVPIPVSGSAKRKQL